MRKERWMVVHMSNSEHEVVIMIRSEFRDWLESFEIGVVRCRKFAFSKLYDEESKQNQLLFIPSSLFEVFKVKFTLTLYNLFSTHRNTHSANYGIQPKRKQKTMCPTCESNADLSLNVYVLSHVF